MRVRVCVCVLYARLGGKRATDVGVCVREQKRHKLPPRFLVAGDGRGSICLAYLENHRGQRAASTLQSLSQPAKRYSI
jgi:hypothetical protein